VTSDVKRLDLLPLKEREREREQPLVGKVRWCRG